MSVTFRGLTKAYWAGAGVQMVEAATRGVVLADLADYRTEMDFREQAYRRNWEGYEARVREECAKIIEANGQNFARLMALYPRYTMVQLVVHKLSQVYAQGADRYVTVPGEKPTDDGNKAEREARDDAAREILDAVKWQARLREAERYCNLLNSVVLWLVPGWGGKIELKVVNPSRLYVYQHPDYPGILDAAYGVAIEMPCSDDGYGMRKLGESRFIRYLRTDGGWTCEQTDVMGNVTVDYTEGGSRPLPALPMIKVDMTDGDDLYPRGGDDILSVPLNIARKLAEVELGMAFAAHRQLVVTGLDAEFASGLYIGPGSFTALPDANSKIENVGGDGINLRTILDTITEDAKLWMSTYEIPPSEFDTQPTERSGEAKFQARQGLYERRKEAVPRWKAAEADLWPRLLDLLIWTGQDIGPLDRTQLVADIPDPQPMLTSWEVTQQWAQKIKDGLATVADYLVAVEHYTRDEALAKVREDANAARGRAAVPGGNIASILEGGK